MQQAAIDLPRMMLSNIIQQHGKGHEFTRLVPCRMGQPPIDSLRMMKYKAIQQTGKVMELTHAGGTLKEQHKKKEM